MGDSDDSTNSTIKLEMTTKRKKNSEFDDENDFDEEKLEDDDYDLLEENLGIKLQRNKYKRVRRIIDDDSSSDDGNLVIDERNEKDVIADRLFEGGDDGDESQEGVQIVEQTNHYQSEESDSDPDDFIVDDENAHVGAGKRQRRKVSEQDLAVQEAQDIFGCDFDYQEFEQYKGDTEDSASEDEYDTRKAGSGRESTKPIKEVFEPDELQRFGLTEADNIIRVADIPERHQLRQIPVTSADCEELIAESSWIYDLCFKAREDAETSTYSEFAAELGTHRERFKDCIGRVLHFIRNDNFEVPYIVFYKKEELIPYLGVQDCWEIYNYDSKFCSFYKKKNGLINLARGIQRHQGSIVVEKGSIPEGMKVIEDELLETIDEFQKFDQIDDMKMHIHFHYPEESVKVIEKPMPQPDSNINRNENSDSETEDVTAVAVDEQNETDCKTKYKRSSALSRYDLYQKTGLGPLVLQFGLSPRMLGENLRDGYRRHDIISCVRKPVDVAEEYVSESGCWKTTAHVLEAARFMIATELSREYLVRQTTRKLFFENATITVVPTKKGMDMIDENHTIASMKFLKDKPVKTLLEDDFLRLTMAEEDKLITLKLAENPLGKEELLMEELKQYCQDDSFSAAARLWNAEREEAIKMAFEKNLFPEFRKELHFKLLNEAKSHVVKTCSDNLFELIRVAPLKIEFPDEHDEDWKTSSGNSVLAIAYSDDIEQATFACLLNGEGVVKDHLRLKHIVKSWNRESDRYHKEGDLLALRNFIINRKPHIIVVGGHSKKARALKFSIKDILKDLFDKKQYPDAPVEMSCTELAKLYASSNESKIEFPDFPSTLKEAVSLGRRIQDPLYEFSQLCNYDNDILLLRLHPLQSQVPKDLLLSHLHIQMIDRVSETGVDINEVLMHPHKKNVLQFCPGFGPAKANGLMKMIKSKNMKLENRPQLIEKYHFGPAVFITCAGFIKIDTKALSNEVLTEPLDGTRIHPQNYDIARKLAMNAIDCEDDDDESNFPGTAVDLIMEEPERLKTLRIDVYEAHLRELGFKNPKSILEDIQSEFAHPYLDRRALYKPLTEEEEFYLLAKETPDTFYEGKLVTATVLRLERDPLDLIRLEHVDPERMLNGLFKCSICCKDDFEILEDIWKHSDNRECPGSPRVVKVMLDNGVPGNLAVEDISDNLVGDPSRRVRPQQIIYCRIMKIYPDKFFVDVTSKSSDLRGEGMMIRTIVRDKYYDSDHEKFLADEIAAKKAKEKKTYQTRLVAHPCFRNVTFQQAEDQLADMDQGELIIRPSSKGMNHLTITWKVVPEKGVHQHVDVVETRKENPYTLGKALLIGNETFEDLDEIVTRYIQPMSSNAMDVVSNKYYNATEGDTRQKAEAYLTDERRKNPNKIHYIISSSKEYPGKFIISYLPGNQIVQEFFTVTSTGYRFRRMQFSIFNALLAWWKANYRNRSTMISNEEVERRKENAALRTAFSKVGSRNYKMTPGNTMTPSHAIPLPSPVLRSAAEVILEGRQMGTSLLAYGRSIPLPPQMRVSSQATPASTFVGKTEK